MKRHVFFFVVIALAFLFGCEREAKQDFSFSTEQSLAYTTYLISKSLLLNGDTLVHVNEATLTIEPYIDEVIQLFQFSQLFLDDPSVEDDCYTRKESKNPNFDHQIVFGYNGQSFTLYYRLSDVVREQETFVKLKKKDDPVENHLSGLLLIDEVSLHLTGYQRGDDKDNVIYFEIEHPTIRVNATITTESDEQEMSIDIGDRTITIEFESDEPEVEVMVYDSAMVRDYTFKRDYEDYLLDYAIGEIRGNGTIEILNKNLRLTLQEAGERRVFERYVAVSAKIDR